MARYLRSQPFPFKRSAKSNRGEAAVVVTGTIFGATEADIVTGGNTIILTVTGDTWIAAGALFDAERQNIINGLTSAQSELLGWNNVVKATQGVAGVVRTSASVVTITLDAFVTYNITSNETITVTVPGTALALGAQAIASPTFSIIAAGATEDISARWMMIGMGPTMFRGGRAA